MVRQNSFVEAYNYVKQMDSIRENKIRDQLNESIQKHKNEIDRINNIRDSREIKRMEHSRLLEDCKNDALATVIKAIYIEALQPEALTDNGLILAESLVDSWIKNKGGASRVIAENRNKTYLLNRLCTIAEEAAFREAEEIEGMDDEGSDTNTDSAPTPADDKKAKVTELMAQAQALIAKATAIQNGENVDTDDDTSEDSAEDTSDSVSADDLSSDDAESSEDNNEENSEESETKTNDEKSEEDSEEDNFDDDTEMDSDSEEDIDDIEDDEESEDDSEEDEDDLDNDGESDEEEDEDIDSIEDDEEDSDEDDFDDDTEMDSDSEEDIDDMEDDPDEEDDIEDDGNIDGSDIADTDEEPTSINGTDDEGESNPNGQIFDDLEQEEDVKKAVEIISQRVADAEEDFVKRNAEDKKKIDDLIGKISDNIKTVEKISDNDSPESKVAEESVRMYNRQIKNITENRPQKVFEKMVRKLSESAIKDKVLKEAYTLDDGKLDIGGIIESAKVMYGFLEALNTLQLERVDKDYIMNVIKEL